jgi:hypothetical protein
MDSQGRQRVGMEDSVGCRLGGKGDIVDLHRAGKIDSLGQVLVGIWESFDPSVVESGDT